MSNENPGALPVSNETANRSNEGTPAAPPDLPKLPPLPDYVTMTSWNTADVDLRRWGQGIVKLGDPPSGRLMAYDDYHGADGRRPLFEGSARLARAFCRLFVGMVGPKWAADLDAWKDWMADFETAPWEKLCTAIFAFRARVEASDNRRGN